MNSNDVFLKDLHFLMDSVVFYYFGYFFGGKQKSNMKPNDKLSEKY